MDNGHSVAQAKVDMARMRELAEKRLISTNKHEKYDLLIHNYTPSCQYSKAWDDLTIMCRGLITDLEGNIISRPFPKFFNLQEHFGDDCKLPKINWKQGFYVSEKFDGSLGIVYPTPDGYKIATRGSFTSDQAIKATEMLAKLDNNFHPDYSYLFEILFPQNRIVVDYGESETLVLLDVIETRSGKSVYNFERFAKELNCDGVFDLGLKKEAIEKLDGGNREGVVVRFEDGTRIKVKIAEYVRLHRLITGTNARSIWEILKNGGDMRELIDRVPDEYYSWVKKTEKQIKEDFEVIKSEAMVDFERRDNGWQKKEFAEYAKKTRYPHLLFRLFDKKDIPDMIWKMIYPKHSIPFHQDIDA